MLTTNQDIVATHSSGETWCTCFTSVWARSICQNVIPLLFAQWCMTSLFFAKLDFSICHALVKKGVKHLFHRALSHLCQRHIPRAPKRSENTQPLRKATFDLHFCRSRNYWAIRHGVGSNRLSFRLPDLRRLDGAEGEDVGNELGRQVVLDAHAITLDQEWHIQGRARPHSRWNVSHAQAPPCPCPWDCAIL